MSAPQKFVITEAELAELQAAANADVVTMWPKRSAVWEQLGAKYGFDWRDATGHATTVYAVPLPASVPCFPCTELNVHDFRSGVCACCGQTSPVVSSPPRSLTPPESTTTREAHR